MSGISPSPHHSLLLAWASSWVRDRSRPSSILAFGQGLSKLGIGPSPHYFFLYARSLQRSGICPGQHHFLLLVQASSRFRDRPRPTSLFLLLAWALFWGRVRPRPISLFGLDLTSFQVRFSHCPHSFFFPVCLARPLSFQSYLSRSRKPHYQGI